MPSSYSDATSALRGQVTPVVPRGPRTVLRQIVSDLSAAARAGCSPSTAAELQEAARVVNRSDPRFWGGAEGVDDPILADMIAASLSCLLRDVVDAEVRLYVNSSRDHLAALAATFREAEPGY